MDLRIEKLKEKYWAGETTLAEEKELKAYFKENPTLTKDGQFYADLNKQQRIRSNRSFAHPGKRNNKAWLSVAAVILILLTMGIVFFPDNTKQDQFAVEDPQEAFEITKASLMMISEGLNKGKTYSKELNKINKAKEIIHN